MRNSTKRARRPLGLPRPQPQRPGPFWSDGGVGRGRENGSSGRVEKTGREQPAHATRRDFCDDLDPDHRSDHSRQSDV